MDFPWGHSIALALARRFLHFESPSRLSETYLEHPGRSSLAVWARLVLDCALCPFTLPGGRGRFYSPDAALPEYR